MCTGCLAFLPVVRVTVGIAATATATRRPRRRRYIALLRQQEARQHLLTGRLVHVRLEGRHRLRLVLRQPDRLQLQVNQRVRQVLQQVAGHIEHVQLATVTELRR
uniref:Putative secreted protein n=1 Tax=Anopheles darlingi TaxID=43151 RepID=A0A2M4DCP0_ANODA